jgi:VWFA-related protein
MRLYPLLCAPAILACAACLESASQTAPAPESKAPSYRSTTRAVVVDIVVSKGDDAIRGLSKRDFQILEDGKPQTIDFFEEHSANTLPAGTLPPLPQMPAGVYSNVPAAPENDSVNVLLLDALNTDRQEQSYVHSQIVTFLKNMQPGWRVAVFVLGSRLRMVQGFTADSSVLRAAVNDPKNGLSMETDTSVSRSLQDKADDVEDKKRMALIGMSPAGMDALSSLQENRALYQADQRVAMTIEALNALGRYLAGVPGRKNLIWFSSSFPITVFPSSKDKQPSAQFKQYSAAIKATADLLTVSKVAVYPIGAEGMMVGHMYDPIINSRTPIDLEGGEVKASAGPGSSTRAGGETTPYMNEDAAHANKMAAMEQLAQDTGGRAFFNTNDLAAAAGKAIADGAHYYTIAYTPTNKKMDGSYRKIEVKVPDEKYRLAYRHGYNADDLPSAADAKPEANPLHTLMMRGMPDATQILFAARVLPASPQPPAAGPRAGKNAKLNGPTTRYSIDFMIRWTDVKLDAQADGTRTGKIDVQLLAYDRDGNAVNWAGGTQMMKLTPDLFASIQKSGLPAHAEIDLPADKDIFLAMGVYDWQTRKVGTMDIPLPAPDQSKAMQAKASNNPH